MNPEEIIKNSKRQQKWRDDLGRRKNAEALIDFYHNNQLPYMWEFYENLYEDQNTRSSMKAHSITLNLTEQLVNQLAVAFKSGIAVEISKKGEEEQSEQTKKREDELKEILNNAMFEPVLKMADKLCTLTSFCAISVVWDSESKSVRLDVIPENICFVEQKPDNPREISAFYYQIAISENTPQLADTISYYQKWTAETSEVVSVGSNGSINTISSEPNPYKQIPIISFRPSIPLFGFFCDEKPIFKNWNEIINKELTDYELTRTAQSHAILAVTDADGLTAIKTGQKSFVNLASSMGSGKQAKIEYINSNVDIDRLFSTIKSLVEFFANSMGISASVYNNSQADFSSGYQLKLSMSGVIDSVNERIPFYQKSTQDLVRLIAKIYSYNSQDTFDNYEIYTKIKPLKIEMSEGEKIDTYLKKITLGTISPVEILMIEEKISREEAEQRIAQINTDNNIGQVQTPPIDILGN